MSHFSLIIDPHFLNNHEDYLLDENNRKEFFGRISAILFNDYCTLYYSPNLYSKLISFFETTDLTDEKRLLFTILDSDSGKESLPNENRIFEYGGYGAFQELTDSAPATEVYEEMFVALISFQDNNGSLVNQQLILDVEGHLHPPKTWQKLFSYQAFLDWTNSIVNRVFDHAYQNHKHPPCAGKKSDFEACLNCTIQEAETMMKLAFFKKSHHESQLVLMHLPTSTERVLFFKSSDLDLQRPLEFHGYHISDSESRTKGIHLGELEANTNYLRKIALI